MKKTTRIILAIWLLGACNQEETTTMDVAKGNEVLASVAFDDGRTLDIVSTTMPNGAIAINYLAKGPYGTKPFAELERAENAGINPIALLEKLAPKEPISQKLLDLAAVIDFESDSQERPIKSLSQDEEKPTVLEYQPGKDFTASLGQGSLGYNCPWQTFAGTNGPWGPFCPSNGGNFRWCYGNTGGIVAHMAQSLTDSAYNTVCVDEERVSGGQARFVTKLTTITHGNVQNEWTHFVGRGSWVQEYTKFHKSCVWGFWCTEPLAGIRYEVHSDDSVWFHAGGRWWKR